MEASDLYSLLGQTADEVKEGLHQVRGLAGPSTAGKSVYEPTIQTYPDATYHTYYQLGISLCYTASSNVSSVLTLSHIDVVNPRRYPVSGSLATKRGRRKDPLAGYTAPNLPVTFRFPDTVVPMRPSVPSSELLNRDFVSPNDLSDRLSPAGVQDDSPAASTASASEPLTRGVTFEVGSSITGKDLVGHFGEPSRKSEGEAGYVESSLEWDALSLSREDGEVIQLGIMVDLRDDTAGQTGTKGVDGGGGPGASIWDRAGSWGWSTLKLFTPDLKNDVATK